MRLGLRNPRKKERKVYPEKHFSPQGQRSVGRSGEGSIAGEHADPMLGGGGEGGYQMDQAETGGHHGTVATSILQPLPAEASAAPAVMTYVYM